jgi:hypothetical protein
MPRKISARTVVNRKALDAIRAGLVDGMEAIGQAFVGRADPPDDPTTAERIIGDYGIWADGRKVAGTATKPRRTSVKQGVTLIAGFPFPARFNELGTIHQPARPFATPAMTETLPGAAGYIKPKVRAKLGNR